MCYETCTTPSDTTGYDVPVEFACTSEGGDACDVDQITCAAGYDGIPEITCTSGDFSLSGCTPVEAQCCANDDSICDAVGAVLEGQTCTQIYAGVQAQGAECPEGVYNLCPFSCGKCDCCSNDFSKCDIGNVGDAQSSCEDAFTAAGAAGPMACQNENGIGPNCPKTCSMCYETCSTPTSTTGYVVPENFQCTSEGGGACDETQITCADGYKGIPVVECTSGDFVLSGCDQVGDCCPDKSNGAFICDAFGTLGEDFNDATCQQLWMGIQADPSQTECPGPIRDLCPFSCGKCDCCSNDFSQCDVEGSADGQDDANTCDVAISNSQGGACNIEVIASNCPGSCEPHGTCGSAAATTEDPGADPLCCSNDPELCDTEGPIPVADQTCDYLKDQLAAAGIEGCPIPMIYEGCPKMCGKCDCCANDLTKCDVGADENTSCQVAYDLSNGVACTFEAVAANCPKTCGLCVEQPVPGTLSFELTVTGVTDDNKADVCQAYADDLGGSVTHCDFTRPARRLLSDPTTLWVDIEFPDQETTANAETTVADESYAASVSGLPTGVSVSGMRQSQPVIDITPWEQPATTEGPGWTWNRLENKCRDSDNVEEPISGCAMLEDSCSNEETIRQCHMTCAKEITPAGTLTCTQEKVTTLAVTIYADSACTRQHDSQLGAALTSITLGTCVLNHLGQPAFFKCEGNDNLVMETYDQTGCVGDIVSTTTITHDSASSPCWLYEDLGEEVYAKASWEGACQGSYLAPSDVCIQTDALGWRWRYTDNACSSYTEAQCSTLDWLETRCPILCNLCSTAASTEDSADTAVYGTIGLVFGIIGMIVVSILLIWSMCVTQCLIDKSGWDDTYSMGKSGGMSLDEQNIDTRLPGMVVKDGIRVIDADNAEKSRIPQKH